MDKPFQRKGAKSNAHVGREFERKVKAYFANRGLSLEEGVSIEIGINGEKPHSFDLGSREEKILVECKSHTWTESGGVPSGKINTWDQAMYMFMAAPAGYRKVFFALKDWSPKKNETLAGYYVRTKSHLIPKDVEIWEFDEIKNEATRLK